jgi:hypothetical protein
MSSSSKATKSEILDIVSNLHIASMEDDQVWVNEICQHIKTLRCKAQVRKFYSKEGAMPPSIPFWL